jgi:hypothetical protein
MTTRVLCFALFALCACACSRQAAKPASAAAAAAATSGDTACLADGSGYLRLRARGAQNFDIDWHGNELQCEGGPRPDLRGVRLTFAARGGTGEHRLRLVLGIATPIAAGSSHAVPVNVTLILEGENRLYSTRGDDKCTLDELVQTPIATQAKPATFRVAGRGFCSAPAAALDGGADVVISRFDFAGRVVDADVADHPQ